MVWRGSFCCTRAVEKTLIPVGIKLFEASFHGDHYKIPGLGRASLAITNLEDGLLLKTTKGNFIITPRNPNKFKEKIEPKPDKKSRTLPKKGFTHSSTSPQTISAQLSP